jgi:hypothetical protein
MTDKNENDFFLEEDSWLCICGYLIENGMHCPNCRNEPPWGCPCSECQNPDPNFQEMDANEDFRFMWEDPMSKAR